MKKFLYVFLVLVLALALTVTAAAADSDFLEQKGTLTVTLKTNGGRTGANLDLVIYQVAKGEIVNNNLVFTSLVGDAFDFNKLTSDDLKELGKVDLTGLTSKTGKTDDQGVATFTDLPIGVYLVKLQNGGRYEMDPFAAAVPISGATEWDFSAEAKPKVEYDSYVPPATPEEPTKEIPDEEVFQDQPEEELEESEDEYVLPDTGLLQWPIAVLTLGGILLFTVGYCADRRARRRDQ